MPPWEGSVWSCKSETKRAVETPRNWRCQECRISAVSRTSQREFMRTATGNVVQVALSKSFEVYISPQPALGTWHGIMGFHVFPGACQVFWSDFFLLSYFSLLEWDRFPCVQYVESIFLFDFYRGSHCEFAWVSEETLDLVFSVLLKQLRLWWILDMD